MEELKNLMVSRTTFINSFKNKLSSLQLQKQSQLMHQLLIEKKKIHTNQSSEIKISRTLIAQKLQSPYKLMQFYESSKFIMKSYFPEFLSESDSQQITRLVNKNKKVQSQKLSQNIKQNESNSQQNEIFKPQKHLIANVQNKKKLILKIIRLYYEFFIAQKSESKAQQIMHIYKKKLCQQNQIAPTLFCWLNDWITKQFTNFIKIQMNNLNQTKNDEKNNKNKFNKSQFRIEQMKQTQDEIKKTIFQVQSPEPSKKKFRRFNKSNKVDMFFSIDLTSGRSMTQSKNINLSVEQNKLKNQIENNLTFLRPRNNLSIGNPQVFLTIEKSKQISPKIKYKDTSKGKRYYSSETSNLIAEKIQRNVDLIQKQVAFDEGESFPINRQIFIGAYYEKYFNMYRNLQTVIPDLDIQYVKQIKRNDRKTELKKRMKEVSRMFIRTQPLIKTSIDEYQLYHRQKNHRLNKLISKKLSSHENRLKSIEGYQSHTLKTIEDTQQKKFRFSVKSQRDIPSNLFDKIQTQLLQTNTIIQSYPKKKQEKLKQTLPLNKPIEFSFNLPKIPDHQKGIQHRPKEQSKIVLIQSGRYRLIDSPRISQTLQLSSKKNNHQELSIDMSDQKQKNKSLFVQSWSHVNKTPQKVDQRSASILSMITKKKKKSLNKYNKNLSNYSSCSFYEENNENSKISNIKSSKPRQKYDYKVPKQIAQVISNLQSSDFYILSGWEKGQETPVIS